MGTYRAALVKAKSLKIVFFLPPVVQFLIHAGKAVMLDSGTPGPRIPSHHAA